jgi:hypothetical protein
MKVFTLSQVLHERDSSVQLNGGQQIQGMTNIFNLFWEKLVHIVQASI